jgi:hypothetical protein
MPVTDERVEVSDRRCTRLLHARGDDWWQAWSGFYF